MGGLFDSPDPPNPFANAAAQTGTNVATAVANAFLHNVNQQTPTGSLSWNQTGNYGWTDPTTGIGYNIPQFTATQSLTPIQQSIQDYGDLGKQQLAAAGYEQAAKVRGLLGGGVNVAGAPAAGNPATLANAPQAQTTFGDAGPIATGFDNAGNVSGQIADAGDINREFGQAGDITRGYEDFASERNRVEQGLMDRLNPSLGIERQKYEQQLADQGIRPGSTAYDNMMRNYSMQANDARLAAIGQAGAEQQRMSTMANQLASFQNQAQQQAYGQELGRGTFANQAQQQQFAQNAASGEFYNKAQQQMYEQLFGRASFANQAQQQLFGEQAARGTFANAGQAQNFQQAQSAYNAANVARQQYFGEQFALRNQPLNEITALMSGSQVSNPNFINANMPTIPTTDVAGLINSNFSQQMDAFKQNSTNINSLIGGLFGLAGNVYRSDRNVKDNIDRVGTVFGVGEDDKKLPIYEYSYKDDPTKQRHVGPMAQDVEKIDKSAVVKIGGVKHIDRDKLGGLFKAA